MKKDETTKQRILSEALKLFASKGYEAVSVAQIAGAVGIKAPSLYKHYESKRDIFHSIVTEVERLEALRSADLKLPEGSMQDMAAGFCAVSMEGLKKYCRDMMLHWMEEPFMCDFRRMLVLEQYHDDEMGKLYDRYFVTGPVGYMSELFAVMTGADCDAGQLAVEFCGPLFLMYSMYDRGVSRDRIIAYTERHVEDFSRRLEGLTKGGGAV